VLNPLPIIGVMGSHDTAWEELATPVGKLLAKRGCHLLTGAGGGVMTAVAKAFTNEKKRAGFSIGIIPTIEKDGVFVRSGDGFSNPHIEIPVVTPLDVKALSDVMPYSRNHVNVLTSHAVIVLPGAHGTRHETSLALMLKKPHVLFGPNKVFQQFPDESVRVETIGQVEGFLDEFLKFFDGRSIFERSHD
jgi:uncharacterized protein (TIGR00725 family)